MRILTRHPTTREASGANEQAAGRSFILHSALYTPFVAMRAAIMLIVDGLRLR
jgi:hypothetical protein